MRCPIDDSELVMTERAGVEIDFCPQCRGVWLDRGELDKIIDRSAPEGRPRGNDGRTDAHPGGHRKKKRGGFLEDLFDF